jgi:hypothetical protein
VVSFTPLPVYLRGKNPQYPLDRLGGPQSQYGHGGEEKYLAISGIWTPAVQPAVRHCTDRAVSTPDSDVRGSVAFRVTI